MIKTSGGHHGAHTPEKNCTALDARSVIGYNTERGVSGLIRTLYSPGPEMQRRCLHKAKARDTNVHSVRVICAKAGLRATPQRIEVLRAVAGANNHPTVEDLCRGVRTRMPSVSLDTVYRTLATFEKRGIVRRLQIQEEPVRYDGNMAPHHHLICGKCRRITDFEWPTFDAAALPGSVRAWGNVEMRRIYLYGLCRRCSARGGNTRRPDGTAVVRE